MIRHPVSGVVLGGLFIVLCDDGTVWEYDPDGRWVEREPLPGTAKGLRVEQGRKYHVGQRARSENPAWEVARYEDKRQDERRSRGGDRSPERRRQRRRER